jgi:hypothetical protein
MGATHWLAATEPSLQRMLARHGFPFKRIGPDSDYFGPVAPYRMDLAEFDQVILSGRFPVLDAFVTGLEPTVGTTAPRAGVRVPVAMSVGAGEPRGWPPPLTRRSQREA